MGTRFLAVEEAEVHPEYLQALILAEAQDTVYSDVFEIGWPNAPHRLLRSSLDAAQAFKGEFVGSQADTCNGERFNVHRFQPEVVLKSATGNITAMSMWAGESAGGVKKVQTAAEIIDELVSEAEVLLRRWRTGDE